MDKSLNIILQTYQEIFSVCQLDITEKIPHWADLNNNAFVSITKTQEELSIVCEQRNVPENTKAERDWRMIKIKGQLDFSLVGILRRVISPLADNGISVYTISTYDTDYILIKDNVFEKALDVLKEYFVIEEK